MLNIRESLSEMFPPKEFVLRTESGMKPFRIGTALQIFIIALLLFTGMFVGLFTYKMQVLQTTNLRQDVALKDLKSRYVNFTNDVVSLRKRLENSSIKIGDEKSDVELQMLKATKLLTMLEEDLDNIDSEKKYYGDEELVKIKNKLEKVIEEGDTRSVILDDLNIIIRKLKSSLGRSSTLENDLNIELEYVKHNLNSSSSIDDSYRYLVGVLDAHNHSIQATGELRLLDYSLSLKEEEIKFYDKMSNNIQVSLEDIVEDRISYIEKIMNKTKISWLSKFENETLDTEIGGPFISYEDNHEDELIFFDNINKFAKLRKRLHSVPLSVPLKGYYVTSGYGFRKDPFSGRRAFHAGIDLGGPWGSYIRSSAQGTINFTGTNGSYGKAVFVDHGYGIQTRYAHLSKILVKEGEKVKLGQKIAKIGNSGRSKGKHLHYEIKVNNKSVNPRPFLKVGEYVFKRK